MFLWLPVFRLKTSQNIERVREPDSTAVPRNMINSMVNSFFALPCLLLLMSCAGSKSEYCEPNFASQGQRWPLANEHDSYEFWRILEVLLVASNKFLRQPCGFQSEAQTDYATHDEADSRHYLRMRSFESYADKYPSTRSRVNCVMCGHPFHLYNSLHATSHVASRHIYGVDVKFCWTWVSKAQSCGPLWHNL